MGLDQLLLLAGGLAAGLFGSLLGLGGGILLVPFLTIVLGDALSAAIGTSLVAVVATSAGAAAHTVRAGIADVRLGLTLQIGSVAGGAAGGLLAGLIAERLLAGLFAGLMVYAALGLLRGAFGGRRAATRSAAPDPTIPDGPAAPAYRGRRTPAAIGGSIGAGVVSALLGVGGGIVLVPLLRLVMGVPIHIAAATSNFVIGGTAAAGAWAFLLRGDIEPLRAAPVVLGAALGAAAGARLAPHVKPQPLTVLFVIIAAWVAFEMGLRAVGLGR